MGLQAEAAAAQSKHDKCVKDMEENKTSIEKSEKEIQKLTNEKATQKAIVDESTLAIEEATTALKNIEAERSEGQAAYTKRDAELEETIATGQDTHKALVKAIELLRGGKAAAAQGGKGFSGTGGLGQII